MSRQRAHPPCSSTLILGFFKLVAVGLLVYLTYFFTMTFANRTPPPAPLSEEQVKLARKAEDLRNQGKTLLASYGWVNPATKSNVRIPIERAMELMVAEAAQPPAPAVVAAPAAVPGPPGRSQRPRPPNPEERPRPRNRRRQPRGQHGARGSPAGTGRHAPEQMYRDVCMACHEHGRQGQDLPPARALHSRSHRRPVASHAHRRRAAALDPRGERVDRQRRQSPPHAWCPRKRILPGPIPT